MELINNGLGENQNGGYDRIDRWDEDTVQAITAHYKEILGLLGPNGAGKTTMMDIITGKTRPDKGTCWFGARMNLLQMSEPEIAQVGIGRKFQKPTVFEFHRVIDNLELALHAEKGVWPTLFAKLTSEQQDYLDETLDVIGLKEQRNAMAGSLSHGQKQWLEIGML